MKWFICFIYLFFFSNFNCNFFQLSVASLAKPTSAYKVYQTMFRVIKESETVDARQHCFLLQSSPPHTAPRYLSLETRQELLRIENSWNSTIITSVIKLGVSKLNVIDKYYTVGGKSHIQMKRNKQI